MATLPQTLQIRTLRRQIGENIRRARRRKNVTLDKLSRRTGISPDRLDRLEMGKHEIMFEHLLPIACALDVELTSLVSSARS